MFYVCRFHGMFHGMFHDMFTIYVSRYTLDTLVFIDTPICSRYVRFTICFTICLFISPDLDGYRAPKMNV